MPKERDVVDEMLLQWSRERPDLDNAAMGIVLRVQVLAAAFADGLKETLASSGLATWEFEVLSALRRAGKEGLTPTELCECVALTSGAMTHRIDRLESAGLVRRRAVEADRRSVQVRLTANGRTVVDDILGARMAEASRSVAALGMRKRRELVRLLRDVTLGSRLRRHGA